MMLVGSWYGALVALMFPWLLPEPAPEPIAISFAGVPVEPFDWHKEYAPLWEPGSKAFWLEPSAEEYQEWLYRRDGHDAFERQAAPDLGVGEFPNTSMSTWSKADLDRWWGRA